jgi:hypothetical protein
MLERIGDRRAGCGGGSRASLRTEKRVTLALISRLDSHTNHPLTRGVGDPSFFGETVVRAVDCFNVGQGGDMFGLGA